LLEKRRAIPAARRRRRRGPVKITLDNHLSDDYTVLEVKCPDRLGLLYLVTAPRSRDSAGHRDGEDRHRDRQAV